MEPGKRMTGAERRTPRQRLTRWFLWGGKEQSPPQCIYCVHRRSDACTAYPGGIPFPILANQVNHRNKHPLDRGIRFSPISLEADAAQRALFEKR
jgi:hypothetical protein